MRLHRKKLNENEMVRRYGRVCTGGILHVQPWVVPLLSSKSQGAFPGVESWGLNNKPRNRKEDAK